MKKLLFLTIFSFVVSFGFSQGSGCATATNLGTIGSSLTCINPTDFSQNAAGMCTGTAGMGYSNYWYRFCTNASNTCVNFEFTIDPNAEWMAALYTAVCPVTTLVTGSVLCNTIGGGSTGGTGYYSTAGNDPGVSITAPNTCYYLRINVTDAYASTFGICYQTQTPPADACAGAIGIDPFPTTYENACATEGATDPAPAQLCAGSLENTVWYSFTVTNPCGAPCNVVITSSNIDCAGGGEGFQIGYFSGTCGSLTNLGCASGSGGTVNATLSGATPGATYYVAMDGNAGANCYYDMSATNTIPLAGELIYFRGLVFEDYLAAVQWSMASETNVSHYRILRSNDGINYSQIGTEAANNSNEVSEYTFNDPEKLIFGATYYKVLQYDHDGNITEFGPIAVQAKPSLEEISVIPNPVTDNATITFNSLVEENATIEIIDLLGQVVLSGPVNLVKGGNSVRFSTSEFDNGLYFARISTSHENYSVKFTK